MAYAEIEPFGEKRADIRAAIVAQTMANIHRGKNKKAYKLDDFMPQFERPKQAPEQMIDIFKRLELALNGNNR